MSRWCSGLHRALLSSASCSAAPCWPKSTARIERVKELLAGTELPMSEVAVQTGFLSPQRMAIVFRKLTSRSPGEYRRQIQQRCGR